jgi:hypothetical protein
VVHQLALYGILNGLNGGGIGGKDALQLPLDIVGNAGGIGSIAFTGAFQGFEDGGSDLVLVVKDHATVALDNGLDHINYPFLSTAA